MYCLWLPQFIRDARLPSSDDCSLQDFEDRLEAFPQAAPEHIAFFRSNPELFAACSCKGEVTVSSAFCQCSASDPQAVVWAVRDSYDTAMRPCSTGYGAHCLIQIRTCVFFTCLLSLSSATRPVYPLCIPTRHLPLMLLNGSVSA